MAKPAPTFIDEIYRMSFRPEPVPGWHSNIAMRNVLHSARRFVVSKAMSAFMADLANESFVRAGRGSPLHIRIADSLLVSARLPHECIWIEYDLHAYQIRSNEVRSTKPPDLDNIPDREGWLIQQHPTIDTACIMHMFTSTEAEQEDGNKFWTFPFAFGWTCDDKPLPWRVLFKNPADQDYQYATVSECLVGLFGFRRSNINCVLSPLIDLPQKGLMDAYAELLSEWTGVLRRVWALLATLDHLPLIRGEVRQAKGFLARGRIRKFLDHQTITINIPGGTEPRMLARKAITVAHKKRHEVRGFWRNDWRHPPSSACNPHLWSFFDKDNPNRIECSQCHGRQSYVPKHERGDSRLGYVTHDYNLTH